MIGLSLVCTAIVVIILLTDFDGSFIGPWGSLSRSGALPSLRHL
jgi:hypothetical protein